MDKAEKISNLLEKKLLNDVNDVYNKALKKVLAEQKDVLGMIDGKDKERALKRLKSRSDAISKSIANAGLEVSAMIKDEMSTFYAVNRDFTVDTVKSSIPSASFQVYDKNQIKVLLEDEQSPFSKIAYKNLGNDKIIVKKLNTELAQSVILGESQIKVIERIRKVTGQSVSQAKRVAQTERNRVQSQARFDTMGEAHKLGVIMRKKWSTRMVNSRESHAMLNGVVVDYDKPFVTINGNKLMFPGDPTGEALEVVNCFCVLVPIVEKKKR